MQKIQKKEKLMLGLKIIFGPQIYEFSSLSSFNRGAQYLLCVIDVFTK